MQSWFLASLLQSQCHMIHQKSSKYADFAAKETFIFIIINVWKQLLYFF